MTTFQEISEINRARANRWHNGFPAIHDGWSGADWSNAMCGEAGEAANIVKKLRRAELGIQGKQDSPQDELTQALAKEIGDTFIYLDLLAQYYELNIEDCIKLAFNKTSEKEGLPEKIA